MFNHLIQQRLWYPQVVVQTDTRPFYAEIAQYLSNEDPYLRCFVWCTDQNNGGITAVQCVILDSTPAWHVTQKKPGGV